MVSPAAMEAAIRWLETGTEISRAAVEKSRRRRELCPLSRASGREMRA